MFWDDLMRRWRREVVGLDRHLLRGAAGNVAAFPAPRRRRRSRLVFWLIGIAIAIALLGLLGYLPIRM